MKTKVLEINNKNINAVEYENFNSDKLNKESIYLVQMVNKSREKVIDELKNHYLNKKIIQGLKSPSKNYRFRVYDEALYGEIALFSDDKTDNIETVALIIKENVIMFLQQNAIFNENEILDLLLSYDTKERDNIPKLLLIIVEELLSNQAEVLLQYRETAEKLSKQLNAESQSFNTSEFLKLKSNLSDFNTVLEKQIVTFNFPPKINFNLKEKGDNFPFNEMQISMGILKNSLAQIEKKLDSTHSHYLMLLQEKSNKRINMLTLVQSVFVPLTLIVGIYGMNFSLMPELAWKYGYFACLGVMVVITIIQLRYFYRNGWFD